MLLLPSLATVVSSGDAAFGGDSRAVQDQLKIVQQIQASLSSFAAIQDVLHIAFAAILGDGSVVTWGDAEYGYGGDSGAVHKALKNV